MYGECPLENVSTWYTYSLSSSLTVHLVLTEILGSSGKEPRISTDLENKYRFSMEAIQTSPRAVDINRLDYRCVIKTDANKF